MHIRRIGFVLALAWALLAIAGQGCAGPTFIVQQYSGDVRPAEEVAIIRLHGKDPFFLYSVDGEQTSARVPEDARIHIEVLPGKHTVEIVSAHGAAQLPRMATFRAEAGRVYRPLLAPAGQSSEADYRAGLLVAYVYEVDAATDAQIRDVTLAGRDGSDAKHPTPGNPDPVSKTPEQPAEPRAPEEGTLADAGAAEPDGAALP